MQASNAYLFSDSLDPKTPLTGEITFSHTDTLKIVLTTTDNKKAARPHQAFLTLADVDTTLEFSFPISVKSSGKGKLDIVCGNELTILTTSPKFCFLGEIIY